MKTITVESGDDLYSIAEKHLGSHKYWRYVSLINDIGVFDEIDLAKPIQVPDVSELQGLIKAIDAKDPEQIISAVASASGIKQLDALRGLASGNVDVSSIAGSILDLSGLRKSGYTEFNLIDWILP